MSEPFVTVENALAGAKAAGVSMPKFLSMMRLACEHGYRIEELGSNAVRRLAEKLAAGEYREVRVYHGNIWVFSSAMRDHRLALAAIRPAPEPTPLPSGRRLCQACRDHGESRPGCYTCDPEIGLNRAVIDAVRHNVTARPIMHTDSDGCGNTDGWETRSGSD